MAIESNNPASLIKRSKLKHEVLRSLMRSMGTSAKISARIGFRASHVTVALKYLKQKKFVQLINPHDKEPDIYTITDLGKKVLSQANAPLARKKRKAYRMSGKRRSIS